MAFGSVTIVNGRGAPAAVTFLTRCGCATPVLTSRTRMTSKIAGFISKYVYPNGLMRCKRFATKSIL